jgi:NADPH2:quinone reductase
MSQKGNYSKLDLNMKAVMLEKPGPPEALRYVDVQKPIPGPGKVLVRAHTIGVGMPEIMVRRGEYPWMPPLPTIVGIEMSGIVEEIGDGVTSFEVGQPVFVSARDLPVRGGCYAEYIAADIGALYLLPNHKYLEAAAALSNYQVAWHLLNTATRGMHYESVLATGAAGGVGSAILQLAKAANKKIICVVDTNEKANFVRSLGAEQVINVQVDDTTARVRELTEGMGVNIILDSIGGNDFAKHIERLAPFGLLVSYGRLAGPPGGDFVGGMLRRWGDSLGLQIFSMHLLDEDGPTRRKVTEELIRLLSSGKIQPYICKRLPLSSAAEAHALIESGQAMGKIVLKPSLEG